MPARELTLEEERVLNKAYERGVSSCMAKAGWSWNVDASDAQPPKPDPFPPIEELRRSGYGADFATMLQESDNRSNAQENDPVRAIPEAQQPAFTAAFNDCDIAVINQIYGSKANVEWLSEISGVGSPHSLSTAQQDIPGYMDIMRAWQQCMRDRGVNWMDEEGMWKDWDSGYWALDSKAIHDDVSPPKADQDKMANDDADCQVETGLDSFRAENLPAIKKKLWENQKFSEADRLRFRQYALANAKKIP